MHGPCAVQPVMRAAVGSGAPSLMPLSSSSSAATDGRLTVTESADAAAFADSYLPYGSVRLRRRPTP